jgi:diaminopropionate ammonia-lyase
VQPDGLAPVAQLWTKDERARMNLGSFKALGAAYVIARHAEELSPVPGASTLKGRTYVTASAGNHGMSVAAGARIFGAGAVVFLSSTVPEGFAARLRTQGAEVVRAGADYAASMEAAMQAAEDNGWILLSDSSWDGYTELPRILMEGYLQMAAEAAAQCSDVPTHIFLQAGVGGLAGAVAAYARKIWGDAPRIVIVEPDAAPALQASIEAGKCVFADGPDSIMGRLDCKEPSLIALNGLARDADDFLTLSDEEVIACLPELERHGLATTASGGAGVAAVLREDVRTALGVGPDARVLCFLSEAAE